MNNKEIIDSITPEQWDAAAHVLGAEAAHFVAEFGVLVTCNAVQKLYTRETQDPKEIETFYSVLEGVLLAHRDTQIEEEAEK